MENLKLNILTCTKCELAKTRQHVIFGEGNPHAGILIIAKLREGTKIYRANRL
jgi:DNA polymerase